jgi:hypothetical protein
MWTALNVTVLLNLLLLLLLPLLPPNPPNRMLTLSPLSWVFLATQ